MSLHLRVIVLQRRNGSAPRTFSLLVTHWNLKDTFGDQLTTEPPVHGAGSSAGGRRGPTCPHATATDVVVRRRCAKSVACGCPRGTGQATGRRDSPVRPPRAGSNAGRTGACGRSHTGRRG